jgi:hypothetical protein
MMLTIIGVQSALLATVAACRKRAAVLKTPTIRSRESAPVRVLARVLSERALSTTTMERVVAAKAATLIRGFVHTTAFDQVVLNAVAHIRARAKKGGTW